MFSLCNTKSFSNRRDHNYRESGHILGDGRCWSGRAKMVNLSLSGLLSLVSKCVQIEGKRTTTTQIRWTASREDSIKRWTGASLTTKTRSRTDRRLTAGQSSVRRRDDDDDDDEMCTQVYSSVSATFHSSFSLLNYTILIFLSLLSIVNKYQLYCSRHRARLR